MNFKNPSFLFIFISIFLSNYLFCQITITSKDIKYELPDSKNLKEIPQLDNAISTSLQLGNSLLQEIKTTLLLLKKTDEEINLYNDNFQKKYIDKVNLFNSNVLNPYNENLVLYNNQLNEYNQLNSDYTTKIKLLHLKPQNERTQQDFDEINQKKLFLLDIKSKLDEINLSLKTKIQEMENQSKLLQNTKNELDASFETLKTNTNSQKSALQKAYQNLVVTKSYFDDYAYLLGNLHSIYLMQNDKGIFEKVKWFEENEEIQSFIQQLKNIPIEIISQEE